MSGGLADNITSSAVTGGLGSLVGGRKIVGEKLLTDKQLGLLGDPLDLFGRRAEAERRKAALAAENARRLEQQRGAIEAVRQAQIEAAQLAALAETGGIAGSSLASGAIGSVKAQTGGNINFLQQQELLRSLASSRVQEAANKTWQARQTQAFGSVAASVAAGSNWGKNKTTAPEIGATDGTNDTMGFSKQ